MISVYEPSGTSHLGEEGAVLQDLRLVTGAALAGWVTGTPTPYMCSRPLSNVRKNVGLRELKTSPANKLIIFQLGHLLRSVFVKCWKSIPRVGEGRNRSAEPEEGGGHEKKGVDGPATALVL